MSELHLSRTGQYCVNSKNPTVKDEVEDYMLLKIGIVENKEWNKIDVGFSAILQKHGGIYQNGETFDGVGIAYLNADNDPDPGGNGDPGALKVNFYDQQIFGGADNITMFLGDNGQGGYSFSVFARLGCSCNVIPSG